MSNDKMQEPMDQVVYDCPRCGTGMQIDPMAKPQAAQPATVPEGWIKGIKYAAGVLESEAGPLTRQATAAGLRAMLAASPKPEQPATVPDEEVLKLLSAVKYIIGIAERGEGRAMREDESAESFVLGYVKRLEAKLATVPEGRVEASLEVAMIRKLYKACVRTLEAGRDSILALGGDCDPVDRMEESDPTLREARAMLAAASKPEQQEAPELTDEELMSLSMQHFGGNGQLGDSTKYRVFARAVIAADRARRSS